MAGMQLDNDSLNSESFFIKEIFIMADETQVTEAQATEPATTDTFVPAWKIQSDKLKKAVEDGAGVQVAYTSNNQVDCEPVLLTEKKDKTEYPTVVEEPVGFIDPKYVWFGEHKGWIEGASEAQGKRISNLEASLNTMKQSVQTTTENQNDAKEENDKLVAQVKSDNDSTQKQLAQLVTMVSTMMASSNAPASPANGTQPTQATQATEASSNQQ